LEIDQIISVQNFSFPAYLVVDLYEGNFKPKKEIQQHKNPFFSHYYLANILVLIEKEGH